MLLCKSKNDFIKSFTNTNDILDIDTFGSNYNTHKEFLDALDLKFLTSRAIELNNYDIFNFLFEECLICDKLYHKYDYFRFCSYWCLLESVYCDLIFYVRYEWFLEKLGDFFNISVGLFVRRLFVNLDYLTCKPEEHAITLPKYLPFFIISKNFYSELFSEKLDLKFKGLYREE